MRTRARTSCPGTPTGTSIPSTAAACRRPAAALAVCTGSSRSSGGISDRGRLVSCPSPPPPSSWASLPPQRAGPAVASERTRCRAGPSEGPSAATRRSRAWWCGGRGRRRPRRGGRPRAWTGCSRRSSSRSSRPGGARRRSPGSSGRRRSSCRIRSSCGDSRASFSSFIRCLPLRSRSSTALVTLGSSNESPAPTARIARSRSPDFTCFST